MAKPLSLPSPDRASGRISDRAPVADPWRRVLMFGWMGWLSATIIGSLLSQATLHSLQPFDIADSLEHFSSYGTLALLLPLWVDRRRSAWIGVAMLPLLGLLMEYLQQLTPDRTFDLYDELANICGILCGAAIGFWWRSRLLRNALRIERRPG